MLTFSFLISTLATFANSETNNRIVNLFTTQQQLIDSGLNSHDRCLRNVKFYSVPYNQTLKFSICNTEDYLNCIEEQFTMIAGTDIFYMNILYGVSIEEMIDNINTNTLECDIVQEARQSIIDTFHLPEPIHNPETNQLIFPHFQKPISGLNRCVSGCGNGLRRKNYSPMIELLTHSCFETPTTIPPESPESFQSIVWIIFIIIVAFYPLMICVYKATNYVLQKQKTNRFKPKNNYTIHVDEENGCKNL